MHGASLPRVLVQGLAEAGATVQAAQHEAAMLREQLQQLTRQKLQLVIPEEDGEDRNDGEDNAPTLSLCTRNGTGAGVRSPPPPPFSYPSPPRSQSLAPNG